MTITIVRLYDDHDRAAEAVQGVKKAGLRDQEISVMTRGNRVGHAATGAEIGAAFGGLAGLLTGLGLIAIPGIGPVVATGWLAATAACAAAGAMAGGALGVVTEAGVSGEEAHAFAEGLRRGATLVSCRVPETERSRYEAILDRGAVNIQVRIAEYRQSGWTAHDPAAPAYTPH